MVPITDEDIRAIVSRNAFEAGRAYYREGHVEVLRPLQNGVITASVRGSGRTSYRQTVRVRQTDAGRTTIQGACSCPVGYNCKHVAAVLFAWEEQQSGLTAADVRSGGSRGSDGVRLDGLPISSPLPPEVEAWLHAVEGASQDESEEYPASVRKRMLYVLGIGPHSGGLVVDPVAIEMLRDGRVSDRVTRYTPYQILQPAQQPRFLRPSDRAILRRLASLGGPDAGEEFIDTLRRILATGRGRWGAVDGPALSEGAPLTAALAWRVLDDGRQSPTLDLPGGLLPLRLAAPWYVDPATGVMGVVETPLSARLVRAILAAPALPPAAATRVRAELARRLPAVDVPAPRELEQPRIVKEPLRPRLELFAGDLPFDPTAIIQTGRLSGTALPGPHRLPLARLLFRYGPATLPASAPRTTLMHEGKLLSVVRDQRGEAAAWERLRACGFGRIGALLPAAAAHPHGDALAMMVQDSTEAWIDFVLDEVPALRHAGWAVEVADDFPIRIATPDGPITAELREQPGIDWFDLDLGVMVDGQRVDLVPALLDLIRSEDAGFLTGIEVDGTAAADDEAAPILLRLSDGRLLAMPLARIQPILALLIELFAGGTGADGASIHLSRFNAADLALLEAASAGAGVVWSGADAIRTLGRQLRDAGGIPHIPVPDSFKAVLRPYQARGVDWMGFLRQAGLGGVLADDMGLGKTVQTLAHLAIEQAAGRLDRPALVVCPTSLVPNWRAETVRFAPSLRVLVLHGPDRAAQFAAIASHDLVITTYPLLSRDHATLAAQEWHAIVLDEAQTIKNPAATTSRLARTLQARQRLCLSGTPLQNHLGELWSLFDFLMPGFLGDRQGFTRRFRTPIEKAGNEERQALLARRVAPFLLRRTKDEVAADLPPKTDIAEEVELGDAQRAIYEAIRLAMHAKVQAAIASRGLARSGIVILDALLKLRQACCDPRLLKVGTAKAAKAGSAKLARLMELLPPMLEDGRRVLLFSQFTSMLALIEAELARRGMPYVLLTGDTRDRAAPVRRFQAGGVPLFLISLKAGGVGLNLTAADTVIHYDPWWNPAVEDQATDRAHRIGQDKPVFVHRLITTGTIEAKMEVLKARKQALVAGILNAGQGTTLGMTEDDLDDLLGPAAA